MSSTSTPFYLKQGDTGPQLRRQLLNDDDTPINLTGATVKLNIRSSPYGDVLYSRNAVVESPATDGYVHYDPVAGDTAASGNFVAEWEVTLGDARVISVPNDGYFDLVVTAQLA